MQSDDTAAAGSEVMGVSDTAPSPFLGGFDQVLDEAAIDAALDADKFDAVPSDAAADAPPVTAFVPATVFVWTGPEVLYPGYVNVATSARADHVRLTIRTRGEFGNEGNTETAIVPAHWIAAIVTHNYRANDFAALSQEDDEFVLTARVDPDTGRALHLSLFNVVEGTEANLTLPLDILTERRDRLVPAG